MAIADERKSYDRGRLDHAELDDLPYRQFQRWLQDAVEAGVAEPTAMTLATVSPEGRPSARVVLLKAVDEAGFVFYSNYLSRKGRELEKNPAAALVFYWHALERQVRVEGRVTKVPKQDSEAYFQSRPRGSQLGAWASPQSEVIENRERLHSRMKELEARFPAEVALPDFWGGYRLESDVVEFWQGRPDRLHDRFRYRRLGSSWQIERLAP